MQSFKDYLTVDYKEGEDEQIKYRAKKRRNGALDEEQPCWKGYKQIGTKTKDGKEVPNCVPESKDIEEALVVTKGALANMLASMCKDKASKGTASQRDLDNLAKALGKKLTVHGNKVAIEGFEDMGLDELNEILNVTQRMKKKQAMRKNKAVLKMRRKMARKRRADPDKIKARATKRARMAMFKKLAGGKSKSGMSYSQRAAVEKRLRAKSGAIKRIARKLLPTVRKDDMAKIAGGK